MLSAPFSETFIVMALGLDAAASCACISASLRRRASFSWARLGRMAIGVILSVCSDAVAATIEASHGSPLRSNHEMLQSASPSLSLKNSGGSRKILYITLSLYRH